MQAASTLFSLLKMGDISISNRICMSALTRMRANPSTGIPNDLHVQYYSQRANAGFILTECTHISLEGNSFPGSTGIYSKEQVEGWKKVTNAVHNKGGKIILQIWHGGRACHPDNGNGSQPISSFEQKIRDQTFTKNGKVDHVIPRRMNEADMKEINASFKKGAENAMEAGFDGLELHGANGYLIDQFLRDSVNQRDDNYGGSLENRCRFPLQVLDTLISVFGAGRVGIKLSPFARYQDISDSNPKALYTHLIKQLNVRNIAFLEMVEKGEMEFKTNVFHPKPDEQMKEKCLEVFRPIFKESHNIFLLKGKYIANNGFNFDSGKKVVESGEADAITYGRLFLANPDLVERFKNGWELNKMKEDYLYFGGENGYTDYPFYQNK